MVDEDEMIFSDGRRTDEDKMNFSDGRRTKEHNEHTCNMVDEDEMNFPDGRRTDEIWQKKLTYVIRRLI